MSEKKQTSFNGQVYQKAYKRLNLSSTNRTIFQRLLGFLIRNEKPFPYSAVALAELTGFSLRTIFNSLNDLEKYRLIQRIGEGKNRRFKPGSILLKIFTTVQNRPKTVLDKNKTTVQPMHQKSNNRATGAYSKTSSSLKHKESNQKPLTQKPSVEEGQQFDYYYKNPQFKMPDELKRVGDWLKAEGFKFKWPLDEPNK